MMRINLTRRESAGVDNVGGILLNVVVGLEKRRPGQSHETGTSGFKDTEGRNELHEGVNTIGLSGAIEDRLVQNRLFPCQEEEAGKPTVQQCSC